MASSGDDTIRNSHPTPARRRGVIGRVRGYETYRGGFLPRFSVVVPAYNACSTLSETLEAILNQEYGDWECVVVDDGSLDDTFTAARSFAERDRRFRVMSQPNAGTAGAYNTGVAAARGDFVVLCSADDILLPNHMREMAALIDQESGYDIYSSNGYFWHAEDDSREIVYQPGEINGSLTLAQVIRNCFYGVGAVYRRGIFDVVGGYRLGAFGEDYDFWMRAMAAGAKHRYLANPLSLHRIGATQKTADLERVYQSDIHLVTDLARRFSLSVAERAAVDETVARREELIARLHEPAQRQRFRQAAARLLGWLRRRHA